MTSYGAGTIGAGTESAGLWSEDEAVERPDPSGLSLAYDVLARGYACDSTTGQLAQMSPTGQRVALTLVTRLGSATAQQGWGVAEPVKHHAGFAAEREAQVRDALRAMTDVEQAIRIDAITTEVDGSRSRTSVTFTTLTQGTAQETVQF